MAKVYATPGVYIEEKSAFPNSAVPVATAVPAFIGYTQFAMKDKKDLKHVPTRISSFGEYLLYFGEGPDTTFSLQKDDDPKKIYKLAVKAKRFLLFYCMKHFFANGGSDCYIVSIGDYNSTLTTADFLEEDIKEGEAIPRGILSLLKEPEPTMLVIPDAMIFGREGAKKIQEQMLMHCAKMASRFAILDVFMDENSELRPDTREIVKAFRDDIGMKNLMWGAAYYPWLETNIVGSDVIDYNNSIDKESYDILIELLKKEVADNLEQKNIDKKRADAINSEIEKIKTAAGDDIKSLHQTLLAVSPLYKAILGTLKAKINLLPPSAAMAGIFSMIDNNIGVFQSPANISVGSVIKPSIDITNEEQEDLNVPLNGKAINAIRTFPGKGVLVWGARTLDGNSQDWRYISVRRTVIFIEQSIKYAVEPYVFAPNDQTTWTNLRVMITNFLTNVWQGGALVGDSLEQAFSVDVGLGTTMTPVDILDGIMRITVKIAVTRPAEFIVITFQQKMQES
jgi:phage tail sheath protein FI